MTENRRWGVIYCPKRIALCPKKHLERIQRAFDKEGIAYDFVQSENSGSVDRLFKMMINNGYKTIVIIGGDSALNDAINCLMQTDSTLRETISLGIIPNGVMNDFAHFWNMREGDYEKTISGLKKHRVRRIDLGCIRYKNKHDESCRRYFANCINIGLIAVIMNLRRQTRHLLGLRSLSFLFSFILLIFQRMDYKMHLKINSDEIKRRIMTICIGSCTGYGQTPNAVPYNGELDVTLVKNPGITQLLEGIYLFLRGKILNHHNVAPYRTRKVEVISTENALVGIDGRLMHTPKGGFTITVEQEVINFLIPD